MIIDFHTHVFPRFFREHKPGLFSSEPAFESLYGSSGTNLAGAGQLIRAMDEGEIQRSVIFGFPWDHEDNYRRHNDYILDMVHRHPDRFIGFCCFSPMSNAAPKETERCLKSGLSGVGELAVYGSELSQKITDALVPVMAVCAHFDVPLVLHTNEPVGHAYPGKTPMTLNQIYGFLKNYPSNRIILAHWGGGLFFYALMKKEVRGVLRNVWFDTAASPFLYEPSVYRFAGKLVGFEKILFGSDYPLLKPQRYFTEMASAGLSDSALRRINGGNAKMLLSLTE